MSKNGQTKKLFKQLFFGNPLRPVRSIIWQIISAQNDLDQDARSCSSGPFEWSVCDTGSTSWMLDVANWPLGRRQSDLRQKERERERGSKRAMDISSASHNSAVHRPHYSNARTHRTAGLIRRLSFSAALDKNSFRSSLIL